MIPSKVCISVMSADFIAGQVRRYEVACCPLAQQPWGQVRPSFWTPMSWSPPTFVNAIQRGGC